METEPSHDEVLGATSPPPEDEGLSCPTCAYNLTGLQTGRCPECGVPFHLEELLALRSGAPGPVPGWDDPITSVGVVSFLHVCFLTGFRPGIFGRRFPLYCAIRSARGFRWLCRLVAVAVFFIGTWGIGFRIVTSYYRVDDLFYATLALIPGAIAGSYVCEWLISAILTACVRRKVDAGPKRSARGSATWRDFVGFYGSFLTLTAGTTGWAWFLCDEVDPYYQSFLLAFFWSSVLVNLLWWWLALCIGVARRTHPTPGRAAAFSLIPVAAAISVAIGYLTSAIVVLGVFAARTLLVAIT